MKGKRYTTEEKIRILRYSDSVGRGTHRSRHPMTRRTLLRRVLVDPKAMSRAWSRTQSVEAMGELVEVGLSLLTGLSGHE
jgi:hypothetical protein